MPRNKHNRLQLTEIVDEALKYLPITVSKFSNLTSFSNVPNIRREQRVNADGLKARRSTGARKWESWVDVQTITFEKETDRFNKI
jgi:hypothetical protein